MAAASLTLSQSCCNVQNSVLVLAFIPRRDFEADSPVARGNTRSLHLEKSATRGCKLQGNADFSRLQPWQRSPPSPPPVSMPTPTLNHKTPKHITRPNSSQSEATATASALPLEVDPGDPPLPREFVLALTRFVVGFT